MSKNHDHALAVVGGDARSRMLCSALALKGFKSVDIPFLKQSETIPEDCNIIILPLPVTRDGVHLNCSTEGVKLVDIIRLIPQNSLILGGCISERLADIFQQNGLRWVDYYAREDVLRRNAYLTAESTLSIIMSETQKTVKGSRALVIGCGRCGKALAKLLKRVGASVTLTSRKKRDKIATILMGLRPTKTEAISSIIADYDIIVNTVPAPILDRKVLSNANPLALIIELASGSVGVDIDGAKRMGLNAIYAPSLPGKCLPESAAIVLRDAIINIISEEFA